MGMFKFLKTKIYKTELKEEFSFKIGQVFNFEFLNEIKQSKEFKFIIKSNIYKVRKIGYYSLNSVNYKNIYLNNNTYLKIIDNKEIKLFTNYKNYCHNIDTTWETWITNIMDLEKYSLHKEELVFFYTIINKFYKNYDELENLKVYKEKSYIISNLLLLISKKSKIDLKEVSEKFCKLLEEYNVEEIYYLEDGRIKLRFENTDIKYENYYDIYKPILFEEKLYSNLKEKKYYLRERSFMLYYRNIENESFDKEFLIMNVEKRKFKGFVNIDLGIEISLEKIKDCLCK